MMPLLKFATVKERPGAVLGVESVVALLVPRALVVRNCSLESLTRRSELPRAGAGARAGAEGGAVAVRGGRPASSARRFAAWIFLAAARTSRCADGSGG